MIADFSRILGHKRQISALSAMVSRGGVPQGLVLSGPEHAGKSMIGRLLAASLLSTPEEELSRHPDFVLLTPTVKESGSRMYDLDAIRDALQRLGQSPMTGQTVVVIDDANVLSVAGQNALLKTLEEPVSTMTIIFIVHDLAAMLPTILSRVVVIPFGSVDELPSTVDAALLEGATLLISGSLVERLKSAQALAKMGGVDIDDLLLALARALKNAHKISSKTLSALLDIREGVAKNGNLLILLEQFALSL